MTNDDLDGIFDHLDPKDFNVTTTAFSERPLARPDDRFETFLEDRLAGVREAFVAAQGELNSIATLANLSIERSFGPHRDEMLGDYINRLQREAELMQARWLFISIRTNVGSMLVTDERPRVDDPKLLEKAPLLTEAVYWYAERLDDDECPRKHGYFTIEGVQLGQMTEGEISQPVGSYGRILQSLR